MYMTFITVSTTSKKDFHRQDQGKATKKKKNVS